MVKRIEPSINEALPLFFSSEIADAIIEDIKLLGLSLSDCAKKLRLKPEHVHKWYKDDVQGFKEMVDEARVLNKSGHIKRIIGLDSKIKVQSSQWFLERKYSKEFGAKITSTMNININEINTISAQMLDVIARHLANVDPEIVMRIAEDIKALKHNNVIEVDAELV